MKNFFAENYKKCWVFFKESKNFIWIAAIVFVLFFLIGFIFPVFFEKGIFEMIKKLAGDFFGLGVYDTIVKIFLNNLFVGFAAIVLGIAFGIFPFIAAVTNGYILGFVANYSVAQEGFLVLWRLLPHGIFELPAIIFSIGIGLRIGIDVLRNKGGLKRNFKEAMRFFVFIILPLLLVAGVVEGVLIFAVG